MNINDSVSQQEQDDTEPVQGAETTAIANAATDSHTNKRERKLRNIILSITVIIVAAIVIITSIRVWNNHKAAAAESSPEALAQPYQQLQQVANKPANATKQGGLRAYTKAQYKPQGADGGSLRGLFVPILRQVDL
ncbi:hypothetical protein PT279_05715 [Bifidobacterium sp. ESL0784]|uniref:hypothetical protein n=1 Tax=Bifidobacterium sp. ESL0784 TaxID=2983231 RepID=UPI0023F70901|nr:hypothetical protein [Bifidobacterium sp. ESL0784]MDF7641085.1 hypothetical protein [Bifidobacterium sp. ESL0784]